MRRAAAPTGVLVYAREVQRLGEGSQNLDTDATPRAVRRPEVIHRKLKQTGSETETGSFDQRLVWFASRQTEPPIFFSNSTKKTARTRSLVLPNILTESLFWKRLFQTGMLCEKTRDAHG